jgi:hypothetical protein
MKGKTRCKEIDTHILKRKYNKSSYLSHGWGNLGPKFSLIHLAIDLIQYDASHDIHRNFSKSPNSLKSLWTPHFLLGIQTFLVLFMVEIILFGIQMRLAPFLLLAWLLALIAITFLFFFFLIKYGVAAFCPPC